MRDSRKSAAGPSIWPPLVIVAVALAVRLVPGWIAPLTLVHFISLAAGPVLGLLGLLVWWAFTRRVPLRDRLLGLAIGVGVLLLGSFSAHHSMPQFLVGYALAGMEVVFVVALVLTRAVAWPARRWILVLGIALAFLPWSLFRQDGQGGNLRPRLSPRWTSTAEEVFLEAAPAAPTAHADETAVEETRSDWPGYRGPSRDGRVEGVSFDTDWQSRPPRELWRRRVGPGWSSFAVAGNLAITQEQRGDEEVVVGYSLGDGGEVWAWASRERFEEAASGAGPRATPTFHEGHVYAVGANGTVVCLDAATGEPRWQHNLQEELDAELPPWGFASSPLLAGRAVVVFAGSDGGESVVAYDRETGDLLWTSGDGNHSYSSGHPASIGGVEQVLMSTEIGLQALDPASGDLLWQYPWSTAPMPRIVQPVILDGDGSLILATGYGYGSKRLGVERDASGSWNVREIWSTTFLKPYFNGLVHHRGHCYGFDGRIFTCIGADDGQRRWKGGRYGHGQVVLLAEMDLLLVITEKGEVVLVEATPEEHREITRFQALTGKTWNHPVITQGKLLVRNSEEAACFELPGNSS